jgi:hypothetical protein
MSTINEEKEGGLIIGKRSERTNSKIIQKLDSL